MKNIDRSDMWQLLFIVIVASAVRFYKLGFASLWLDEALTIKLSGLPFSVLWVTPYDTTPPLYYSVIHLLLNFGHSEFLLRLASALFGVVTIVVVYVAIRKVAGSLAAFMGALLLSLSFHNIDYSQEARAYALLGMCLSISFLGLTGLATRWRDNCSNFTFATFLGAGGGLYALGLIAALYTHNIAVFYWLGAQIFFLVWWVRPFRLSLPCLVSWGTVNLSVLLLWTPWLMASLQMIDTGTFSWLPQPTPEFAVATWRSVHGFRTLDFAQPYADFALLLAGIGGIYSLRRNTALLALFVGLLAFSSAAIWAYGLVGTPIFMLRTILWGSFISAALIGMGLSRLPKIPGAIVLIVFVAGEAKGVYDYHKTNFAEGEDWRSVAAVISQNQKPNDLLLIRAPYTSAPLFYYIDPYSDDWEIYGWNCSENTALSGSIQSDSTGNTIKWQASDLSPKNPIPPKPGANLWIVESHCFARDWNEADAIFLPNWRLHKSYGFKGVGLHWLIPATGH